MSNSLNILLVEDDISSCIELQKVAEDYKDINIVKVVDNSYDALSVFVNSSKNNSVATSIPNVVILDLELNNGGSGINFLSEFSRLNLSSKPFILVTTNNPSRIVHDAVEELGADFYLYKSAPDYTTKFVLNFLNSIKKNILSNTVKLSSDSSYDNIIPKLTSDLLSVGFSSKSKGFNYILDAILFYLVDPKNFLDMVAQKNSCAVNSIAKTIARAIRHTWDTSNVESLKNYTGFVSPKRGNPTLIELISHYAQKYKHC